MGTQHLHHSFRISLQNVIITRTHESQRDKVNEMRRSREQGWNFKWWTPVKIASNYQNLKGFLYSDLYFDDFSKILAVFDG